MFWQLALGRRETNIGRADGDDGSSGRPVTIGAVQPAVCWARPWHWDLHFGHQGPASCSCWSLEAGGVCLGQALALGPPYGSPGSWARATVTMAAAGEMQPGASTTFLPHHHHERCADQGHLPGFPRPRGSHGLSGCALDGLV